MGGQRGFHAWFIDDWLEEGHSRGSPLCTTFTCPCPLSKDADFKVDCVEVWAVRSQIPVNQNAAGASGILENKDLLPDKLILQLGLDKQFYSDRVKNEK